MTPELPTGRLLLKPLQLEDAVQVQQLFPRWEIVQFLNARVPWPFPDDGVFAYYRDVAFPAIESGIQSHWTLRLRESPEQIIGSISLVRDGETNRGFWIAPEWQGRGLMTEAVIAANDYWFDVLGFGVLRAKKAVANVASRRISEKTGMRIVATMESDYVAGRFPTELWEITADEWHEARERQRAAYGREITPSAPPRLAD